METSSNVISGSGIRRLEFAKDTSFQVELRRRVDEVFRTGGRRQRDCWQMYLKTAVILACFASSYALLVFAASTLLQGLAFAALLGLSTTAIGFNIQHDGGHQAYSNRRWVNRLAAMTLDLIGGSSYVWHWKHVVVHHMFVNVTGYDNDIDIEPLGRFTPHQKRRPAHRWQHFSLWPIYGFDAIKLQFVDDFRYVVIGSLGPHRIPRPRGWELVIFVLGKVVFFGWAFAIPLMFHPVLVVLFYYFVTAFLLGLIMVLVFVLPHLVADAEFPLPREGSSHIDMPWAVHQARVTVDFGRRHSLLTWLLGGLNYHKEHHLFPMICHVNYPAISPIVRDTCREFGVDYKEHESFGAGLREHFRWLRRMGNAD